MEKLNNNTLALQALLTKVNNLPEGGSSGGGASVETCELTVYNNTESIISVSITLYDDIDGFGCFSEYVFPHDSIALMGVLCGSSLIIWSTDSTAWMGSGYDGLTPYGGTWGDARWFMVGKNIISASITIVADDMPPEPI